MGRASRSKGQRGERELAILLAELTGRDVRRRVRQHGGDADLEGLPGWAIECKRYARATPALLGRWWQQACAQAQAEGPQVLPLLCVRTDRAPDWVFYWPAGVHVPDAQRQPASIADCVAGSPLVWCLMVRRVAPPWQP